MLKEAGWNLHVDFHDHKKHIGKPRVVREFEVMGESSSKYIDYAFIDGKENVIAILEAKRTSKSADSGKAQGLQYANYIEKVYNSRPFIFYSNGYETYLWDDLYYPERKIWGFYSLEKLEFLLFQRKHRMSLNSIQLNPKIIDRGYQMEGVRRVLEDFETKRRKALLVMATGTGKTRVAMSIIDTLLQTHWIKRVLFLADRRELRQQAEDAFKKYIPYANQIQITSFLKSQDKNKPIFTATYNSMMSNYLDFPIDFFDLIIADESHRSIYNYYSELFRYFDALQIGLTATPVGYINRNTFTFFERPANDPTFYYSLEEAVTHNPPYLVKYRCVQHSTKEIMTDLKKEN
ncbi:MAG: DEAD/DEAH box helicase family protein [Leptospiraceae bacterium]|nr:DEAD/DEAH box helicase family protein [Leptospiraceae bacterium]